MKKRNRRYDPAAVAAGLCFLLIAFAVQAAEKKKSKLAPQALVYGSVFQESGFLLRGARVVVHNVERPKERKETTTDMQGEFGVRVPAGKGRYTIEVSAPGFVSQSKTVEVASDERIDVTFRLAPQK